MPKMTIKAYETVIDCDWLGNESQVLIGVEEEGHPDYASWESAVDEKIYFYLTAEEMANLKIGDVLNDGEDFKIVDIDKDNPIIFEIDYELKDKWEICYDDSGESERYGEGRWYVADENGMVLGDASFHTKQEAEDFLKEYLENEYEL